MSKKTRQAVNAPQPPTDEEIKLNALTAIFDKVIASAQEFLRPFDTAKYRTIVLVDHQKIGTTETLLSEMICYHFNVTLGKSKNGNHQIYFNYDSEAITKFSTRVYNQMLRLLVTISAKEVTTVNIEDRVKFSASPSDVRNFFYMRLIEGEIPHITIQTVDKATV